MKNILNRMKWGFIGSLLLLITIGIFYQYNSLDAEKEIDKLPDYDYITEIKQLINEKKYGEAKILAQDVVNLKLPCAAEAKDLFETADKNSKKVWNRIYKTGKGFITGNPDHSIEEIGGSMISDLFMYGDIRDLTVQGYFKITGKETDSVIIALASVGLATELIDVADWAPAALKAIKKANCMTKNLADSIISMGKKLVKTRKADKATKAFFSNTKNLLDSAGFIRTKNMFKNVKHTDDLAILAKNAKVNPSLTHITAKHAGDQTVNVLKNSSPEFLRKVARKGRYAVRFMKTFHKHKKFIKLIPQKYIYILCGILLLCSFGSFCMAARKIKKNICILNILQ